MSQALIRTQAASIIGSQWLNTDASIFLPTAPALTKGFIRELIDVTDQSGLNFAPSTNPRFQISRDVDLVSDVALRWTLSGLPAGLWNGGATFARWVQNAALTAWEQIEVKSGTQRLQTINPIEIMLYIQFYLEPVARRNALRQIFGGTPAERTTLSTADYEVMVPLYTCLGLRLHGDPSQSFFVRGLNDYLSFNVRMRAITAMIETDGTIPTQPAAGWYQSGVLQCCGYHVNNDEREKLVQVYSSMPYALTFDDQQYTNETVIPAATTLPFTQTIRVTNITQPVSALFYWLTWRDDEDRLVGGAGGNRGSNFWNVSGWYNAGGGVQSPILGSIQMKSGNNDILKLIPTERLIRDIHYRDFKGDANVAVPAHSYSHNSPATNAVLGFISFEQIEQPQLVLNFITPIRGAAFATVGAAATADIGTASDLYVRVIAFTKMEVDQARFLLSRPYN